MISIAGIVADITESRRVTEKLRESEARFRGYFELGLVGMFISSPSKGWVEVNDELCRILGYERDALLGESWENLTHPDDLAANLAQFDRVVASEIEGYTMDKRFIRKSGEIIETTISVNCVHGSDGSVVSMLEIVEEITARKNAEATRDRLAAIIESTTDLVGFTDPGGQMLYLNRAGRQLLGWGPDEDITDK